MIDLFIPPIVRARSATYVHRLEPAAGDERYCEIVPRKRRGQSKRAAYYRTYHTGKREARLKSMKEYYEANKAEAMARAKKWKAENPIKAAVIQAENQRRRNIKRAINEAAKANRT